MLINVYVLQNKIETIRKEKETAAESILRTQFKMEAIVYTQDSTYSKKLGKRKREAEQFIGSTNSTNNNECGATLKEMTKHLASYYEVSLI